MSGSDFLSQVTLKRQAHQDCSEFVVDSAWRSETGFEREEDGTSLGAQAIKPNSKKPRRLREMNVIHTPGLVSRLSLIPAFLQG